MRVGLVQQLRAVQMHKTESRSSHRHINSWPPCTDTPGMAGRMVFMELLLFGLVCKQLNGGVEIAEKLSQHE